MNDKRAFFVSIEGLDGAGKRTQTRIVQKALIDKGIDVSTAAFPRYGETDYSKLIVEYVNGLLGDPSEVHPKLASLLFTNERLECKPWLDCKLSTSQILIADRFTPSNMAYQAAKYEDADSQRAFSNWLYQLEHLSNEIPTPDLVIYLKWPVANCVHRIENRSIAEGRAADAIEKNTRYLERVDSFYCGETFDFFYRTVVVDCLQFSSIDEIGKEVTDIITKNYATMLRTS